jgi:hypothetical protein
MVYTSNEESLSSQVSKKNEISDEKKTSNVSLKNIGFLGLNE